MHVHCNGTIYKVSTQKHQASNCRKLEIEKEIGRWRKISVLKVRDQNPRPNEEVFNLNLNSSEDEKRYPNEQHP